MSEKYILELDRKEAVLLGSMILKYGFYKTSYEPLQTLCQKIDTICKDVNRDRKKQ